MYPLHIADVAEQLGLSIATVRRLASAGRIRYAQFGPRGHLRFRQVDVDHFVRSAQRGEHPTNSDQSAA